MIDKKYPDTMTGAKECLKKLANKSFYAKMERLEWKPDPQVEGVWGVFEQLDEYRDGIMVKPKTMAIVYLSGYREPFGTIRERNDFEG